jgi:hypothetical protein
MRDLQREVDALHDEMRRQQSQIESKLVEVKQSMQQEYEKRIAKLEETCMGLIVLLQSSTSTCSSLPTTPSSSLSHALFLAGHSSSGCFSNSLSSSMISPPGIQRSFWPSATLTAPPTSAVRRGSWGTTTTSSSNTTTTTTGSLLPQQNPHDPSKSTSSSMSTATSLSPGTRNITSSDKTTLMMLSTGLIR